MTDLETAKDPASTEASSVRGSEEKPIAAPSPGLQASPPAETVLTLTQSQLNAIYVQRDMLRQEGRRAEFMEALAKAQGTFGAIHRSKMVHIQPRDKAAYTFRYAPLEDILAAVVPALTQNGFSLSQSLVEDGKGALVLTELQHPAGQIENRMPVFYSEQSSKAHAAGVTYARRYGLTLLLCLAADDDAEEENPAGGADPGRKPVPPAPKPQPGLTPTANPAAIVEKAKEQKVGPVTAPTDKESIAQAEGMITDAMQEMLEAATEGRKVGVEQIWEECKANPYVAQEVWARMKKKHPDAFATMKAILKPPMEKAK
jgi:ERF superfamily